MGCGSSAAALVAGVALASHFGGLRLDEAADPHRSFDPRRPSGQCSGMRPRRPDGLIHAQCAVFRTCHCGRAVASRRPFRWPLLVVMPETSLSTSKARALATGHLFESRHDRECAGRGNADGRLCPGYEATCWQRAMNDRIHQPYRAAACPLLLPLLLPFAGQRRSVGGRPVREPGRRCSCCWMLQASFPPPT